MKTYRVNKLAAAFFILGTAFIYGVTMQYYSYYGLSINWEGFLWGSVYTGGLSLIFVNDIFERLPVTRPITRPTTGHEMGDEGTSVSPVDRQQARKTHRPIGATPNQASPMTDTDMVPA